MFRFILIVCSNYNDITITGPSLSRIAALLHQPPKMNNDIQQHVYQKLHTARKYDVRDLVSNGSGILCWSSRKN